MAMTSLHGVSILVVDDDPDARELMRMFLRPTGATVVEARDGYEARTCCTRASRDSRGTW